MSNIYDEEFESGNFPITPGENYRRYLLNENPMWMPTNGKPISENVRFAPRLSADVVARHGLLDGEGDYNYESDVVRGWFGLDWVFVPVTGGSTVKPGNPKLLDANDWQDVVEFPDVDAMDWERSSEVNREFLNNGKLNLLTVHTGMWERLISLMDVEGAAVALIDEDQQDAVKAFFDANADFLIKYLGRAFDAYAIDGVYFHDDWGTQNAPFFSLATCEEMILPPVRKIVDFVHSRGKVFDFHSCGKGQDLLPAYIASDADCWCPQEVNDITRMAEMSAGNHICYGYQALDVPEDATDAQIAAAAEKWFDTYKDTRLFNGFRNLKSPVATKTLYRLSREYYAEKFGA